MSRTYAHTPMRVLVDRAGDTTVTHYGCELDAARPEGRLVGHRIEHTTVPAGFGKRSRWVHVEDTVPSAWAATEEWAWFVCDGTRCGVSDGRRRDHREYVQTGWIETYIRVSRVPVFEVVPCDASWPPGPRRCSAWSDEASAEAYGHRHRCVWPRGAKRTFWYGPERAESREFARRAAAEFNTHGGLDECEDEPPARRNPSGLWGGGWID